MAIPTAARWDYADNGRLLVAFLLIVILLAGGGILALRLAGGEGVPGAGVLLSAATFVLVFAALLVLPRVLRRGVRSYRLFVDRPIDEVERDIREAFEGAGHAVSVRPDRSRAPSPARVVRADGVRPRFRLEPVSPRNVPERGVERTEVIQIGVASESDSAARSARDLVEARLARAEDSAT